MSYVQFGENMSHQLSSDTAAVISPDRRVKVVIAKPGLDGHDRGAKVVARALRDAGMEVVYTGIFQTPESILRAVIQEDADVLGLSSLSGAHLEYAVEIASLLRANGADDVVFLVGGTIPDEDAASLRDVGVAGVFGPGTTTSEIIGFIHDEVAARRR